MKFRKLLSLLFFGSCFFSVNICGQSFHYSTANAHSHNDYEQKSPFWLAYNNHFGSIEADIFLVHGELMVAHDSNELKRNVSLEISYLHNLAACLEKNEGYPYPDPKEKLQLLIDIKSDSLETLNQLIWLLNQYPQITGNPDIRIVITGRRPDPILFAGYPSFIYFDGVLSENYPDAVLPRIKMFSDDFRKYSAWNGKGKIPWKDRSALQAKIKKAHELGIDVRLWNAPDIINAWMIFEDLQVDYINTDHIADLSKFMHHS
jgi:alkaline phosphatase